MLLSHRTLKILEQEPIWHTCLVSFKRSIHFTPCFFQIQNDALQCVQNSLKDKSLLNLNWDRKKEQFIFADSEICSTQPSAKTQNDDINTLKRRKRSLKYTERFARSLNNEIISQDNNERLNIFLSSINMGNIFHATNLFKEMIENDLWLKDPKVPEDCLLLLVFTYANMKLEPRITKIKEIFLEKIPYLLSLYMKSVKGNLNSHPPYRTMAYIYHCVCQITDTEEKINIITKFKYIWTHTFKLSMSPLFQHHDILTESDLQFLRLVSNIAFYFNKF